MGLLNEGQCLSKVSKVSRKTSIVFCKNEMAPVVELETIVLVLPRVPPLLIAAGPLSEYGG